MPIEDILNIVGAASLLLYGIASLLYPHRVAQLIAQQLTTPRGVAEFRVVNGGYFIGLAGFALAVQQPMVYAALGLGWLGAAFARLFAFTADRPALSPVYAGLLAFEIIMGVLLLV